MYNNVYINNSTVCNGIGIFANKNITEGNIITWYYGFIVENKYIKQKKNKRNKYIIEYKSVNKKKCMIGISDIKKIRGKGLAQFANDAIHYKLTGKNNNSYFIQKGRYIFLIASRNINKYDEILVSYGMEYWKKEINYKYNIENRIYNNQFKEMINILYYFTKLIKDYFLCDVYEIREIKNNKIRFYLTNPKRWCINYNIWHYNEDFYILFKNDQYNNIINVFYSCLTCKYNHDFLIDKTNIDILKLF